MEPHNKSSTRCEETRQITYATGFPSPRFNGTR